MLSSGCVNNQGADHRANSAASYAADRLRQALRNSKIRIRQRQFINNDKLSHHSDGLSLIPFKSTRKSQIPHFSYIALLTLLVVTIFNGGPASAEKPAQPAVVRDAIAQVTAARLTSEFRTAISDKPLRDSLQTIADVLQVNLWLDRAVDPTLPVSSSPQARTGYQSITSIAQSAGLQLTVVGNVLLVGRGPWVEQTAAVILTAPASGKPQDIEWPEPTTPTQAVIACGIENQQPLPHDLWPAVHWRNMDTQIAHQLIAAQFNLMPSITTPNAYDPLVVALSKMPLLYPLGTHAAGLRAAVAKADKHATVKEANAKLLVVGTAAAHLAAVNAWLGQANAAAQAKLDLDKTQFSLQLENTAAEQVFRQLASTAGLQLVIDPAAVESCHRLVSLNAKDQTLRELCSRIASAVEVSIELTEAALTIKGP